MIFSEGILEARRSVLCCYPWNYFIYIIECWIFLFKAFVVKSNYTLSILDGSVVCDLTDWGHILNCCLIGLVEIELFSFESLLLKDSCCHFSLEAFCVIFFI